MTPYWQCGECGIEIDFADELKYDDEGFEVCPDCEGSMRELDSERDRDQAEDEAWWIRIHRNLEMY